MEPEFLQAIDEENEWEELELELEDESEDFSSEQDHWAASISFDGGCSALLVFPLIVAFLLVTGLLLGLGSTPLPALEAAAIQVLFEESEPKNIVEAEVVAVSANEESTVETIIAPLFTPEVLYWQDEIIKWAEARNLDPNLVATIMQIESCGDPTALSQAGARGLFQVMPYHFAPGENAYTPHTNAERGLSYLVETLEARNGNARLALAAYNGGIRGTQGLEVFWPNETQRYVYWGANIYQDAAQGKNNSPTLQEWLGSGGASLCRQASQHLGLAP
ncbi:MAG: hypothetical protein DWQ07_25435 [Chloroflexi bacterium]|nr:MAG: hypothetical protein DWQ07_25435 [Chloroflexota bacterium]MBL1196120.1 hypothetical protein [Chloroflexota bacterium]NOH13413.1 transglycosylase SLT domain-containing protein [Chloroflexota bacterium]